MTKNGQKWPKNRFLEFLKKTLPLILSGICVNENSYGSLTFCENSMLGKNLVLKLEPKMALGQ